MRCFRRIVRILGTALMLWICLCQVQAAGAQTETEDGEISVVQEELLGQIELEEIQKLVDGILDEKSFSIKDAVMNMMKGEEPISKEAVQDMVRSFFFSGINQEKGMLFRILLLILLAAVLSNFADVFENGYAGNVSFYIVYLVLFMTLMENFANLGNSLTEYLVSLTELMRVLAPAYFIATAASAGASTATVFYEGVLILVWGIQWLLLTVLRRKLQPKAPVLFTALSMAFVLLLPLLHIALYRGMPDLLGVAFAFMLLALGVGYDFARPAPARLVSLAAFTGLLMLTRRSYMFTVVAFFLLYGIWVLARAACTKQGGAAMRFVKFAAASLFCVGVPLLPMFWRIVRADYSDRYATYQTGGFLAELANQRVYLGWLVFAIMLIGILYGLYKKQTRSLAVLSAVGAVLTVLLVTRVQNMDDHQSLAVAPFYLLGCFLCALLVSELPWVWPRRAAAAVLGVLCGLNFGACSQLLPVILPNAVNSGLYFYVDSPRSDLAQVAAVNDWLRQNCSGANSAYMICHGVVYSPDVFRVSALPDETIREILPYGACNPGNDAFPKELLTAQVVLTCTPFDPNNHTEKLNAAFLENQEKYAPFEVGAEFDMGNGYTITAYRRIKAPTVAELDTYRSWLAEEDARFPYNFSAVWDALAVQFANNG